MIEEPAYYSNDCSGYDSVKITETLVIPEGYKKIKINIISGVNDRNRDKYSSIMLLDRVFFEPLDDDIPSESYSGPFTESVYNNATLTVSEDAVDIYCAADGWKLFKNVSIDTSVNPIYNNNVHKGVNQIDNYIYDINGRSKDNNSNNLLPPGIYIINGKKYLLK